MVFLTGDTHGDFIRFHSSRFPEQQEMTRDDIVIVLGDFGGIWYDCDEEKDKLNWLEELPFTLCYVDGNHENFQRYYEGEFEIVDFHGGKAHKVRDNVYHLMRGHIFDFEGKKFFAMGGASSHDIDDGILDPASFKSDEEFNEVCSLWSWEGRMFRVKGLSWWPEEIPSKEEMDFGEKNLREHNYTVDYVISHCLPQEVLPFIHIHDHDDLTLYFNKLLQNGLKFDKWYCGHYHMNTCVMGKFNILYYDIVRII